MGAHTRYVVLFLITDLVFKLINLFLLCFLSSLLQAFVMAHFVCSFKLNIIKSST